MTRGSCNLDRNPSDTQLGAQLMLGSEERDSANYGLFSLRFTETEDVSWPQLEGFSYALGRAAERDFEFGSWSIELSYWRDQVQDLGGEPGAGVSCRVHLGEDPELSASRSGVGDLAFEVEAVERVCQDDHGLRYRVHGSLDAQCTGRLGDDQDKPFHIQVTF